MRVHPHIPVGEIAASMPHVTKLFDVFGVDYVLHGKLSLRDACAEAGVDPAVVKQSIEELPKSLDERPHWADLSVRELLDELEKRRHPKLRVMLADLATMLASAPPGEPGLTALREAFMLLYVEVEPHLHHEEHALFPRIREVEECWTQNRRPSEDRALAELVGVLSAEHVTIVGKVALVREAAIGIRDDDGMCSRLLDAVAELAREIRDQIHLANNVLFPRALGLEEAMLRR